MASQGGEHVAGNHSNPPEVNYMGQTQQSSNPYLTSTPPQQWGPPTHNGYPPNYYYDPNVQPGSNPNTSQYQTVQSSSIYPPYQPSTTTFTPYQSSNTVQYNYNSSEYSSYYNNSAPNQNNTGAPYQIPQSQSSNTCSASSMTLNNSNPPQSNTAPPPPLPPPAAAGPPPVQTGSYYYHNQNPNQGFAYPGTPNPGSTVPNNSYQYQHQHQHQYNNQWPYPPPPPGGATSGSYTTNLPPPGAAPIGALSGSYPPIQPPPPPGTVSSFPSVQESGAPYQNKYPGQYQMYPPKPVDPAPLPTNNNNQGNILYSQNPNSSINQTPPLNPIPYPGNIMPQARPVLEGSKLTLPPPPPLLPPPSQYSAVQVSKMQIATNPRIAPGLGSTGTVKNSVTNNNSNISTGTGAPKPAYVSVSILKNQNDSESKGTRDPDSILKGALPVSLRAYVERSFSRCRNDTQRSSNEILMKQIITNASSDGTLFTKNWDMEPLFPLPTGDSTTTKYTQEDSTSVFSSLTKSKRKSRWEPVEDQTPLKPPSINYNNNNNNNNNNNIITPNNNYNNNYTNNSYSAKDNISSFRPDPSPRPDVKKAWNPVKFVSAQKPSNQQLQSKKRKYVFSRKLESQNPDSSSESDDQKDLTKYYASAISLANTPEEKKRRESRSKRFDKRKIENFAQNTDASIFTRKANAMLIAKSFNNDNINNNNSNNNSLAVEDIDWDSLTVKGTCQEIEKKYLRLTSAPDPSTVRREDVLEKALEMVLTSNKNYLYKCDQLKSIRQDLTVQRIQNELTVKVYETHARLALQSGDMAEYNQCQSQLKRLYKDGINGCKNEFSAYHLLHVSLHSHNKRDLLSSMSRLSIESKEDEAVEHALKVRSAVCSGNYVLYFRLYKSAPNLNTFLMDLYAEKMRFEAVKCMAKAYRPNILVRYVSQVLGFVNDSEECEQWLRAHGAVVTLDNNGDLQFDTKASMASLYMPEPENAVSHGDASLAVDDFFTRAI